jgi:hypothetical protein
MKQESISHPHPVLLVQGSIPFHAADTKAALCGVARGGAKSLSAFIVI